MRVKRYNWYTRISKYTIWFYY